MANQGKPENWSGIPTSDQPGRKSFRWKGGMDGNRQHGQGASRPLPTAAAFVYKEIMGNTIEAWRCRS